MAKKQKKKSSGVFSAILLAFGITIGFFVLVGIVANLFTSGLPENDATTTSTNPTRKPIRETFSPAQLIEPGDVFTRNSYIEVSGVQILYNGEEFEITNSREDIIIITAAVVGVKADGSYQAVYYPAFSGIDEAAYKKDLEENGWAVKTRTNRVRSGETLTAKMEIYDLSWDGDFPPPDVDGDGYYDIMFTIHPQRSEDSLQASTADPESDIYKLKA